MTPQEKTMRGRSDLEFYLGEFLDIPSQHRLEAVSKLMAEYLHAADNGLLKLLKVTRSDVSLVQRYENTYKQPTTSHKWTGLKD